MTEYNNGNWHGWNGGRCPVHPETMGEFLFTDGSIVSKKPAGEWDWNCKHLPIVAFRVTKPYVEPKKPREWFALVNKYGDIVETAKEVDELDQCACEVECIVVREVV